MQNKECYPHHHMSAAEYGFYDVCRSLSHQSKVLYFSGRGIAARFSSMSKSSPYNLADSLSSKGWFVLLKDSSRRRDGTFTPRQYRVLSHAEWLETHPNECRQPVQEKVLDTNQPVPLYERPVPLLDQPVQREGHNLTITYENKPRQLLTVKPVQKEGLDEADELVRRFGSKGRKPRQVSAAREPIQMGAPVPPFGLDKNAAALKLGTQIATLLGLSGSKVIAEWQQALVPLLEQGHPPADIRGVALHAIENIERRHILHEGPTGFAHNYVRLKQFQEKGVSA